MPARSREPETPKRDLAAEREALLQELHKYEGFLRLSNSKLDEANQEQPDLIHRVSREFQFAKSRSDAASLNTKETVARADGLVRREAEADDVKLTEPGVKAGIQLHHTVRQAEREELAAKEAMGLWKALLDGFEARGYAIKEGVSMFLGGYFSDKAGEAVRRDLRDNVRREVSEAREQAYENRPTPGRQRTR